jgi:hypothetical protein
MVRLCRKTAASNNRVYVLLCLVADRGVPFSRARRASSGSGARRAFSCPAVQGRVRSAPWKPTRVASGTGTIRRYPRPRSGEGRRLPKTNVLAAARRVAGVGVRVSARRPSAHLFETRWDKRGVRGAARRMRPGSLTLAPRGPRHSGSAATTRPIRTRTQRGKTHEQRAKRSLMGTRRYGEELHGAVRRLVADAGPPGAEATPANPNSMRALALTAYAAAQGRAEPCTTACLATAGPRGGTARRLGATRRGRGRRTRPRWGRGGAP